MRSVVVSTTFVNRRSDLYAQALIRPLHHYGPFLLHMDFSSSRPVQMNLSNGGWSVIRTNAKKSPGDRRSNQFLILVFVLADSQECIAHNLITLESMPR